MGREDEEIGFRDRPEPPFDQPRSDEPELPNMVRCAGCQRVLPLAESVGCACHKYGYGGHEDQGWCSMRCLEASHPEPPEPEEEPNES